MKPKTIQSILAAALLAPGALFAQTTATTTPVGYVTMPVAGGGTPSAPVVSYVGPSLPAAPSFTGASLAGGSGSLVSFAGTPLSSITFGLNTLSEPVYYAEVVTGPNAGAWSDIVSGTPSSITTVDAVGAIFSGQTVVIRKHHTLGSLFGGTIVPFLSGLTIGGSDELGLVDSLTQTIGIYYFSQDDGDFDGFPDGWVTSGGVPAKDKVISPMDGIQVNRKAALPLSIVQLGEVKLSPTRVIVNAGLNILPINRAVGSTMRLDGFTGTAALGGRTGSNLVGSGLVAALTIGGADELSVLNNGSVSIYYNSLDDGDFDGFPDGWVKSSGDLSGDLTIPEGSGLAIFKKSAGNFLWVVPAQPVNQAVINAVGP